MKNFFISTVLCFESRFVIIVLKVLALELCYSELLSVSDLTLFIAIFDVLYVLHLFF